MDVLGKYASVLCCILCLTIVPAKNQMRFWKEQMENHIIAETDLLKIKIQEKGGLAAEDYKRYQEVFQNVPSDYQFGIVIAKRYVMPIEELDMESLDIEEPGMEILDIKDIDMESLDIKDMDMELPAFQLRYRKEIEKELETKGFIPLGKNNFFNIFVEKCNVLTDEKVIFIKGFLEQDLFFYTNGGEGR